MARWPGSTYDARIFNNSNIKRQFEANVFRNHVLLGDRAYPCRHYILTPFLNPVNAAQMRYNKSHAKTRSVIERSFGLWKRRFPCLHLGLRTHIQNSLTITAATAVLNNIAIEKQEHYDIFEEVTNLDSDVDMTSLSENIDSTFSRRNWLVDHYFSSKSIYCCWFCSLLQCLLNFCFVSRNISYMYKYMHYL